MGVVRPICDHRSSFTVTHHLRARLAVFRIPAIMRRSVFSPPKKSSPQTTTTTAALPGRRARPLGRRLNDCGRGRPGSLESRNKGDGSETDSTSTSSIYYCSLCSIAVNSHAQMQSHHAGIKHRQRANGQTQKRNSRSSSTSSEPPGEIVAESGYTSGSGDEVLLRVGGLEADGTGPSYKCQLCSVHMNSEAQAKQHLNSPKHILRASGSLRPFRRKTSNSFRKKMTKQATVTGSCEKTVGELEDDGCETSPIGGLDDTDLRSETPSPELGETDSTLTV
uniref:C2H2-type domain-containing protein n=1 Tax=Plectus sambesii TaxID=2011161 RepID=A0A914V7C5_9BILA